MINSKALKLCLVLLFLPVNSYEAISTTQSSGSYKVESSVESSEASIESAASDLVESSKESTSNTSKDTESHSKETTESSAQTSEKKSTNDKSIKPLASTVLVEGKPGDSKPYDIDSVLAAALRANYMNIVGSGAITKENLAKLTEVDLQDRKLVSLKGLEFATGLMTIDVTLNRELAEIGFDLGKLKQLKTLKCANTGIVNLDVSKNTELIELDCSNGFIEQLNLANNKKLTHLYCQSNILLKQIDLKNNPNLEVLWIGNCGLQTIDLSNQTNLQTLYCENNKISELDLSKNSQLKSLKINTNLFTTVDVSHLEFLESFDCQDNELSTVDVSKNKKLFYFNCSFNLISELDVSYNTGLFLFFCTDNSLKELDLSQNLKLRDLACANNKLPELDIKNNVLLEEINCSNNSIREIDVSTCSQLKKLNISKNLLESLDLVKAISLTTLDCSQNKIGSIQFSENTKLKTVNCSTNQLKEFDYDKLPVVEDLNISANQLSRLDISNHDKLRKLTANDNELTTIQTSPNDTLANLQLENNNISDIGPLNNLKNINTLGLSQNQITDIRPLYGLEELGNFYIRDQDIKVPVPKVVNRRTTLDIFKTTSQKGLELPDFPTIYNSYTINGDLIELHDITPVILNEGSFEFSYNPYSIKEGALWYGAKYYTGTVTFLETSELSSVLEPEKHKFNDGEKINWTLKIKNELKKKATNIKVKMDSNSEFIIDPESTKVAGTDSSVSIADGIDLEDLATNEEVTITFSATMSGKADELVEPTGEVTWEAETVNSPYSNIINGKGIKGAEPEQIDHPDKENDLVILSTPRMFHFGLFNWSTDDFDNRNLDAQKYHHLSNVTNTGFYVRIKQNKTTNWSLSAGLSEFTDEKGSPMPGTVGTRLSIAKPTVERVLNHETHEEKIVTNPENPPTLNQDLSFYAGSSAKTILSGATNSGTDQNVWQVRIPFKSVTLSLPTNSGLLKKDFSASFTWSLNDTP